MGMRPETDLLRYVNGKYTRQPAPDPERSSSVWDIAVTPTTRSLWAVGHDKPKGDENGDSYRGVIYRYDY